MRLFGGDVTAATTIAEDADTHVLTITTTFTPVVAPPVVVPPDVPPSADVLAALPLATASSLTRVGSFRLPQGQLGKSYFGYPLRGLAFRPSTAAQPQGSLFASGYEVDGAIAEVSIPGTHGETAALLQPFADATHGTGYPNASGWRLGGMAVWGDRLFTTRYVYYDTAGTPRPLWVSPLDLSQFFTATDGAKLGAFTMSGLHAPDMCSGYWAEIPHAFVDLFGGTHLVGNCGINTISRASLGPAANVVDLRTVGTDQSVPVVTHETLDYPIGLTPWPYETGMTPENSVWNGAGRVAGAVWPQGTRSVLLFGTAGLGKFAYGYGTDDPLKVGTRVPTEPDYFYFFDPARVNLKGGHAYPYIYRVWAYDALDLLRVRQGLAKPWELRPYAMWEHQFPVNESVGQMTGVAYDPATRRLWLGQPARFGDWKAYPEIHEYTLGA